MIIPIKVIDQKLDEMGVNSQELIANFVIKDSAIVAFWPDPKYDNITIYAGGDSFIVEYKKELEDRLLDLMELSDKEYVTAIKNRKHGISQKYRAGTEDGEKEDGYPFEI